MKRLLGLLCCALLSTLALGQGTFIIGMVSYRTDAHVPAILSYEADLNAGLEGFVELREIAATAFCTRNALSEQLARISHWVEYMDAVDDLAILGIDGLVLTPPPPVPETAPMQERFATVAAQTPTLLTVRRVPGLDLPLVALEATRLGAAWGQDLAERDAPFAVVGFFGDPLQADILSGLQSSPAFRGAYEVLAEDGRGEASQAFQDHADLAVLIVTDPSYATGAAEIAAYVRDELGRDLKLGVLGAPLDWEDLMFDKGLLHGVVTWDHFGMLLRAAQQMERALVEGKAPQSVWIDARFYGRDGQPRPLPHPYDAPDVWASFWD